MKERANLHKRFFKDAGFTLLELLVSLTLSSIILGSAALFFLDTSKQARDQEIMAATREEMRTVLDLVTFELRLAGAGMHLSQENFVPGIVELGDAPLPVLTDCTNSRVTFRYSEHGETITLTSDWKPAIGNREFDVDHTNGIKMGMEVYVSNLPRGKDDALAGIVSDFLENKIEVQLGYYAVKDVVFLAGSVLHPVQTITYESSPTGQGIMRTMDGETLTISANSSLEIEYLDGLGNEIPVPLTVNEIWSSLAAVRLTITTESSRLLRSGLPYETQVQHLIVLRNIKT